MDTSSTQRPKRRLGSKLVSLLAMFALIFGFTSLATGSAEAAAACKLVVGKTYPGGPGHPSTVRAGVWKCGGHEGFCIDFGKGVSNSTSLKSISAVPGKSTAVSQQIMYLANKYSTTKGPQDAADAGFAIWKLMGGSQFKKWYAWAQKKGYISDAQVKRINTLISDSKGVKPKLTVKLESVFVGKTGDGSVTVVNGLGKPVVGVTPKVTLSKNAKFVTKPGKTNEKGVTTFTFKPTDVGQVKADASLRGPSSTRAYLTRSSGGHQRILVGGLKSTYRASAQFEKHLTYEVKTVCNSDCNGIAKVTFTGSLPSDGVPARYTFFTGSKTWATFDLAPGQTTSQRAEVPDGTKVSGTYTFLDKIGGKPITKSVSLGKAFEVICPPWLKVSYSGDCDCNGAAGITLKLAAPGGTRYYQAVVLKNGKTVATKKLGKTGTATVSVVLAHGDRVVVSFTAYRSPYKGAVLHDTPFDWTRN